MMETQQLLCKVMFPLAVRTSAWQRAIRQRTSYLGLSDVDKPSSSFLAAPRSQLQPRQVLMSSGDIIDASFSGFTKAAQEDGEGIPGPLALEQLEGFTSPASRAHSPSQSVQSVVRRPTAPHVQEASSRRRSAEMGCTASKVSGKRLKVNSRAIPKTALHQASPRPMCRHKQQQQQQQFLLLRAQAEAIQQAFENQISGWASNGNGETVMAHAQGAATAAVESLTIIMALVATLPVRVTAKQWVSWRHSPTESLPSFVDTMIVHVPDVHQAILKVATLERVEAADVLKHAIALTFGRFGGR